MAFHARVSDPSIGGTYMTFLNTLTNLGSNWPGVISLWLLDRLTWKQCSLNGSSCDTLEWEKSCTEAGGICDIKIDGYYIESVFLAVVGFIWLLFAKSKIKHIESLSKADWKYK